MYWEKRLERAPKNVLSESLFRDEIKRTTPPPSRKGGGETYKPTTAPPVPPAAPPGLLKHLKHLKQYKYRHLISPHKPITPPPLAPLGLLNNLKHLKQYKYRHRTPPHKHTGSTENTHNMYHRQHNRISNTDIVLYKQKQDTTFEQDYACKPLTFSPIDF